MNLLTTILRCSGNHEPRRTATLFDYLRDHLVGGITLTLGDENEIVLAVVLITVGLEIELEPRLESLARQNDDSLWLVSMMARDVSPQRIARESERAHN